MALERAVLNESTRKQVSDVINELIDCFNFSINNMRSGWNKDVVLPRVEKMEVKYRAAVTALEEFLNPEAAKRFYNK